MTLLLAVFSVPINTVWGIIAAIQITRNEFWGKTFVMAMLDLPFSISPVVTGTAVTAGLILHSSIPSLLTACCVHTRQLPVLREWSPIIVLPCAEALCYPCDLPVAPVRCTPSGEHDLDLLQA